uniref:Uncharacterized protein n=1 Tax=viral metagenome TaxID=1070528 RepID=A0A6M3LK93_9ZZZZ
MINYYLICIWDDVEPELFGPFPTHINRDAKAKRLRKVHGNEHGLFPLDVVTEELAKVEIGAYSGGFFET